MMICMIWCCSIVYSYFIQVFGNFP